MQKHRIAVVGTGYVGLSNAVLLARKHSVRALDIDEERIALVNCCESPIEDSEIQQFLAEQELDLEATTDSAYAFEGAEYILIATPTNYDPDSNYFDTSSVEAVLDQVAHSGSDALVVLKSTIPVGYTECIRTRYPTLEIVFSPEFLREGRALFDNLYPSRIIVGDSGPRAAEFGEMLRCASLTPDVQVTLMNSTEAEAVKLFANTFLATRVAFFNELDTFAETQGLNSQHIIEGVCGDPRIGNHYNNPSFGYGGYCLPKDTRQLLANFKDIPNNLIAATVEANNTRMDFVANSVMARSTGIIGFYRLTMKAGSDNFRSSSIQGIIRRVTAVNRQAIIHEPELDADEFLGVENVRDLAEFKRRAEVIVANRVSDDLKDCADKVYSRDLFGSD